MTPTEPKPRRGSGYAALTALCTMAYFISYVSRLNLGACMVELVQSGYAPKNTVALALSVCSVTYGVGQILSGILGDHFRPQNVILSGFVITGAVNLCVAFLPDAGMLTALWAVNGFAQALMWPPMLSIIASRLSGEEYSRACVWVGRGGALGTMAVYALAPVLIRRINVQSVFLVSGAAALMMAVAWKALYEHRFGRAASGAAGRADAREDGSEAASAPKLGGAALALVGSVMLAIALQGMLRDGVTNWLPTFVSEFFHLDSSSAIMTGVLLPVFNILCLQAVNELYLRKIHNELLCAGTIFGVSAAAALLCTLWMDSGALTVLLIAVLVACMHGVNHMLVSVVPRYFQKYGHMALISGVFNSSTYVGSAISTYGIALFSEEFGWRSTVLLWAGIAGAGTAVCLALAGRWKRFAK